MADNRKFDTPVDTDGKEIGTPVVYSNQFVHDEDGPWDKPTGREPNDGGASTVYPEWWKSGQAQGD